jgi:hypothetical protein
VRSGVVCAPGAGEGVGDGAEIDGELGMGERDEGRETTGVVRDDEAIESLLASGFAYTVFGLSLVARSASLSLKTEHLEAWEVCDGGEEKNNPPR